MSSGASAPSARRSSTRSAKYAFISCSVIRICSPESLPSAWYSGSLAPAIWLVHANIAEAQRTSVNHPGHVSGAELVMVTGALGCLHAWLFHGVRWDEGWAGYGNRIHRADFKRLSRLGAPIELSSTETRTRVGPSRVVLRYQFEFRQEGEPVYVGDQSAMFMKDVALG